MPPLAPSLAWLFVTRVIGGITMANMSTAGAYIADVTGHRPSSGLKFGMLGAAWGMVSCSALLGGVFGAMDPRLPFWVAGGIALINAAYGFLCCRIIAAEKRSAFRIRTPIRWGVKAAQLDAAAEAAVDDQYALSAGASRVAGYVCAACGLPLRLGCEDGGHHAGNGRCRQHHRAGRAGWPDRQSDRRAARRFCRSGFGRRSTRIYGLAPRAELVLGRNTLWCVPWGLFGPAAQALMTREVSAEHQGGNCGGANSSLMGLTGLVGPLLFSYVLSWAIGARQPTACGRCYLLAAVLLAVGVLLAMAARTDSGTA